MPSSRAAVALGLILLIALGARLLSAQDARVDGQRVHPAVVSDYKRAGQLYAEHFSSFLTPNSPLSNPDLLAHPPGYSLLWALVFNLGGSDRAMQLIQIVCDVVSVFVLFLIAGELLPKNVAILSAMLAALAPQFTWNSAILLPDTLSILPILFSIYFLVLALKRKQFALAVVSGAFLGVSCWFRPNALLLAPIVSLIVFFIWPREIRKRHTVALLCGALLIIAPLTIRNAIVFHHFVPLSLGAGQTVLEGIADYDREGRFGIPVTDIEIMREEAAAAGRPDYADTLFGPDGVARERQRLSRAFGVICAHPLWFAGVMVQRGVSMLRLERAPVISPFGPDGESGSWLRIPRTILSVVQRLFITAIAFPLALLGIVGLIRMRAWGTIALLLIVPAYYLVFQSAIHTEYRYILVIYHFFFVLVATGVSFALTAGKSAIVNRQS
jgi:4-amino-4-deoxy-L-arabinose transferase-like glycosyltransferase